MNKQKIILLLSIVVLAAVYIWQSIDAGKNTVRDIELNAEMDGIRITLADGTSYSLMRQTIASVPAEGEESAGNGTKEVWVLDSGEIVEDYPVSRMETQLRTVRVLDTVSDSGETELYDLDGDFVLTAEALQGEEVLRTIRVGKSSDTTAQTYAQLDDSRDILLLSGSLFDTFGKTPEELIVQPELEPEPDLNTDLNLELPADQDLEDLLRQLESQGLGTE